MKVPGLGLLCLLLAGILAVPCQATPSTKEYAVAINQAGRQRMLSQKMSKEFLLVSLNIDAEANKTELTKTIRLFESSLNRLLKGDPEISMPNPPNAEIAAQLELVKTLWTPFKATMEKALTPSGASAADFDFMAKESTHLVTEMDKAVSLYENASIADGIKGTGTVVNVAGRQRMLTQRISKNILLLALDTQPDKARADLQMSRDLFDKSLKGLSNGDASMKLEATSNKTIRQLLAQAENSWSNFDQLIGKILADSGKPNATTLRQVAEQNVKLLADCQKVVSAYETETY